MDKDGYIYLMDGNANAQQAIYKSLACGVIFRYSYISISQTGQSTKTVAGLQRIQVRELIYKSYIAYVQVGPGNSYLYNSQSAITRTTFGRRNPARRLNCVSITWSPL